MKTIQKISQKISNPIWVVIPAAGIGSRMNADQPKQYLTLKNKTVLDITISKFVSLDYVTKIIVCLNSSDKYWCDSEYTSDSRVVTVLGGESRSKSVLNGLEYVLNNQPEKNGVEPWVLVHDAARPCVTLEKINELVEYCFNTKQGAILAVPVSDTVKQVKRDKAIQATLDRSQLWLAHTPQFFSAKELKAALEYSSKKHIEVTDEASAIENMTGSVDVILDRKDNIKITYPEDLDWANYILEKHGIVIGLINE